MGSPKDMVAPPVEGGDQGSELATDTEYPLWNKRQLRRWKQMNEQFVDDVNIGFFYKPHTIIVLALTMVVVIYLAFNDEAQAAEANPDEPKSVARGLGVAALVFLVFSTAALPNGPFVRPHPAVWRCVLGISVLYWLLLVFALFQTRFWVRDIIVWLNRASIPYTSPEDSPEYANDCSFTVSNLYSRLDIFILAHALGWVAKTLMLRSVWLCWLVSIAWEVTEVIFSGILPNFSECWWDQVIYDVVVCNGFGILVGHQLCRFLECRTYRWEAITDVPSLTGKVKRVALQFTPSHWTVVQWDPFSSRRRVLCTILLCFFLLLTELSTFLLKHVLMLPTKHSLNVYRLIIWVAFGMPALRQLYIYMTDKDVKRLGTQAWVACGVLVTELLVCIKFGRTMFNPREALRAVMIWISVIGVMVAIALIIAEVIRVRAKRGQLAKRAAAATNSAFAKKTD
ncbi:CDP-diacylglycerol--serine O-phosphatidyltransferase 2 [Diplonema papillatum]|nr:CDP-diacylglycerol--serine O-phosphatidyltransferase 2 [Diplonema papillatum]|eukprot:gene13515-20813_t